MARPSSKDPLTRFSWLVQIDEFQGKLGFTHVDAPGHSISVNNYPEGGAHLNPKVIIDSISYKPIALQRGVTSSMDFYYWAGAPNVLHQNMSADHIDSYRREIKITHLSRTGAEVKIYTLYNAIPIEFYPASDFDAMGDEEISIERLVLAYEGYRVESIEEDTNPFRLNDLKRIFRKL